ncbi:DCC1-like thiol-disulfide oxidoreductase family protein [Aeoliella sp.]|uniref:DCC1-like thiol-disulfide oxidoreductase family protein n=1 Tax=Aeoliella sp. TaxID=2795800 RepID=UPI003CCC4512
MPSSPNSNWRKWTLAALAICWLGAIVVSFVAVPKLVLDGFDGTSVEFVNNRIDSHRSYGEALGENRSRAYYEAWAASYSWKAAALATLLLGTTAAFVGMAALRRQFWRFLFAPVAPLNLAVLRVVVFSMMLLCLLNEPILEFAKWERENYKWPNVAGLVLEHLPINVETVSVLMPIAIVATVLAILGLFTRTSAWISVLLAIYLLGIPQCSGKVNHTLHHVVLIGILVACGRAGDALSIDSLWQAIRRADRGRVERIARSVRYGMPIRFSMLVLAITYFFPGFWKVASNGLTWIFSDNLHNQLLQKWFEIETFEPAISVYDIPGFTAMGALTAVFMELGWPLAVLWKPTRVVWACLGLFFHNMTRLLMNISFYTMQAMYVMFVDWQRLFTWLGRKMFGEPITVLYDGNCELCRRTMSVMLVLDWLHQLRPVNAFDRERFTAMGLGHLEDDALMRDMHAGERTADRQWRTTKGYDAYQRIAWRVPLLWPTLLLVYLPPVAAMGRRIYRHVADTRACSVPIKSDAPSAVIRWSAVPLVVVAVTILSSQIVLGVGRIRDAWPVSCYPLFDTMSTSTIKWPEFDAVMPDGAVVTLDDDALRNHFTESRYVPLLKEFVSNEVDKNEGKREELVGLVRSFVPIWQTAGYLGDSQSDRVRVYIATYELTGPQRPTEPAERTHLLDLPWSEVAR